MSNLETLAIGAEVPGVWVTIADLAKMKGVSRQTAHERVTRLERDGLVRIMQQGRSRLVELATYDRAVGQVGDASKEIGAETKREAAPQAPTLPQNATLRDAQADRAQYEAKLKALDYAERTGQLVPIKGPHGVEAALIRLSEHLLRDLNQPLSWVSEIMEKAREGEPALRRLLRGKIHEQRQAIATHVAAMAGEAAALDAGEVSVDVDFGDDE
jgi:DNA-binding transcriptional ArsR family regulator